MYVSVTGLKVKRFWHLPRFWWHAMRSFRQAQRAPGVRLVQVRNVKGYQQTLTCWHSRRDMLNFMRSRPHIDAIRAFGDIATGRTYGWEADAPPNWDDALAQWREKGRDYEGRSK